MFGLITAHVIGTLVFLVTGVVVLSINQCRPRNYVGMRVGTLFIKGCLVWPVAIPIVLIKWVVYCDRLVKERG